MGFLRKALKENNRLCYESMAVILDAIDSLEKDPKVPKLVTLGLEYAASSILDYHYDVVGRLVKITTDALEEDWENEKSDPV